MQENGRGSRGREPCSQRFVAPAGRITGDHALTALAIARELGLKAEHGALTGTEIDNMCDAELRARAPAVDVVARAAPEHKLRLVEALQAEAMRSRRRARGSPRLASTSRS
jgi:hypothetical protein